MKNENALVPAARADMDIYQLGEVFHRSGYFKDIRDASQAVVKILAGRELGFEPMMSLMGVHIIEGKPSLSANLLAACVKRSGRYDYRVKETTNEKCAIEFRERAGDKWESLGLSEFTIQDAQRAGVVRQGGGWTKYPKAMLFARALSQGVRTYCPDVTMGTPAYVPEELGAEVNEEGDVIGGTMAAPSPKTADKVPVSREPIDIGRPRASAGGVDQRIDVKTIAEDAPKPSGAQQKARQADVPPGVGSVEVKGTPTTPKPPDHNETDQAVARAANFARSFREALRKEKQPEADALRHQWLFDNGFIGSDGKPSAKVIMFVDFFDAKERAVKWARAQ